MIRALCLTFMAVLFVCPHAGADGRNIPVFTPPDWIAVSEVSSDMNLGKLPTGALHLSSRRPAAAVLNHFRLIWNCGSGEKVCRQASMPPWQVLSRLDGRTLEYLQVRDLNPGATGYLAISELRQEQPRQAVVPLMQGSQVVNDLTTGDPGRTSRIILARNDFSVTSNGSFYRDHYTGQGWRQVTEDERADSQVLVFHRGTSEAHLVLSRQQGATQIVINLVQ
jgi:hypothetical protein